MTALWLQLTTRFENRKPVLVNLALVSAFVPMERDDGPYTSAVFQDGSPMDFAEPFEEIVARIEALRE